MSTMLKEVYDAFKEAGASEEKASAAAIAVAAYQLNRSNLTIKEDIAKLKILQALAPNCAPLARSS